MQGEQTPTRREAAVYKKPVWLVFAISLIIIGFLGILGSFSLITITWEKVWPVFLIVPGLIFEFGYFRNRKLYGFLVPGGILIVLGILFFFCSFIGYNLLDFLWPVFIMAPGIGLLQMYFFATRSKGVFIGGLIPFSVGALFMFFTLLQNAFFSVLFPVVLIAIGAYLLLRYFYKSKKR
jgi:hypothetical protein